MYVLSVCSSPLSVSLPPPPPLTSQPSAGDMNPVLLKVASWWKTVFPAAVAFLFGSCLCFCFTVTHAIYCIKSWIELNKCIYSTNNVGLFIHLLGSMHTLLSFPWVTETYSPPSVILVMVLAVQWSIWFPQSVFRRGPSASAHLCLVYQHYWLQVMFWTESIWPLEGF